MLVAELPVIREAHCMLVSAIGRPIDQPQVVDLGVRLQQGGTIRDIEARAEEIVREHLAALNVLWRESITGTMPVW
jgi:S-adenosylmethionine synthetase